MAAKTATDVAARVAMRVWDAAEAEATAAVYLGFVNDAIDDLVANGWLLTLEEDETTTMAEDTYEYDVPASFAYVYMLIEEDADGDYPWENVIPPHQWRVSLDAAGDPEFHFDKYMWGPTNGKKIKVVGQKRPAADLAGSATPDPGMVAFIRERAVSYAADYLAQSSSELSEKRQETGKIAWNRSEMMLAKHPMEYRVWPSSVYVPGR